MIFHSIRWRLQLWHGLLLLVVLLGFGFTALRVARDNSLRQTDAELEQTLDGLFRPPPATPFRPPPPPPGSGPSLEGLRTMMADLVQRSTQLARESGTYVVWWREDGSLLVRSPGAPSEIDRPAVQVDDRRGRIYGAARTRGNFRELYRVLPFGDTVLIGRSIVPELNALGNVRLSLLAAGLTIWLLGLAGGWWLTKRALQTVDVISETAEKIAAGDLSRRIRVDNTDSELGRLANVLNSTFARLQLVFEQQAQFTADASHELRTPIAVVLAQSQSALNRERTGPEYREALQACGRAAQRMRALVESLLQLARLDAGQELNTRHREDLAAIATECVDFVRPIASQRGIRIVLDLQPAECLADREQISQVVTNLLTNALQFNRDSGEIRISTILREREAWLTVSDTGEGIPAQEIPLIFDRFYRVDKSRSRQTGRSGLGLAICKAIVEAHQGTLSVSSEPGAGSTFTVRLPAGDPVRVKEPELSHEQAHRG